MEIDLHAAAHTYLVIVGTANKTARHPSPRHVMAAAQAAAALTAAEELWAALTGLTGRAAIDYAEELVKE